MYITWISSVSPCHCQMVKNFDTASYIGELKVALTKWTKIMGNVTDHDIVKTGI